MYPSPLYMDSVTLTSGTSLLNPAYAGNTLSVAYCATGHCDIIAVCAVGTVVGGTSIPAGNHSLAD